MNMTIHLAEQRLGRSRFYRYANLADGVWGELANVPGQSHCFDGLEPALRVCTRETHIGRCRVRLVSVRDVLATASDAISRDAGRCSVATTTVDAAPPDDNERRFSGDRRERW